MASTRVVVLPVHGGAALWVGLSGEEVAQVGEAVAFGFGYVVEGCKHGLVACLVEVELYAELGLALQFEEGVAVGEGDDHAASVNEGDGGGEVGIVCAVGGLVGELGLEADEGGRTGLGEELHGAAVLEEWLYVVVVGGCGAAEYLYHELVEGVVV